MPRDTSDWDARQAEQALDALGEMGVPHMQQRTVAAVPPAPPPTAAASGRTWVSSMVI